MIKFSVIFFLIFATSAERPTFECKFENTEWNRIGDIYTCRVTSGPSITDFQVEDVAFTGTHEPGKANDDVQAIHFHPHYFSNKINFFPRGIEKTFKNLLAIAIQKVGLKAIYKEDLQPFENLILIDLIQNSIQVLEEGLFGANPNLKAIWLNDNRIKFIHETVFDNLNNLTTLYLLDNTCNIGNVLDIREHVLRFIQVAKLNCVSDEDSYKLHQENNPYVKWRKERKEAEEKERCRMCQDENKTLKDQVRALQDEVEGLVYIYLRIELTCEAENENICRLTNVDVKDHREFIYDVKNVGDHQFTEVIVQDQTMPVVPKKFSQYFKNITKLTIIGSKLNKLNSEELQGLQDLEVLKVTNNRIQGIDFVLPCTKLMILDLSSNEISTIAPESLDLLMTLEELYLDKNALTSLPAKIFRQLLNLQALSLNENQLTALPYNVLPCPNNIKKVSLADNKLIKIEPKVIRCLKSADLIDFSGNSCIDEKFVRESDKFPIFLASIFASCADNDYEL